MTNNLAISELTKRWQSLSREEKLKLDSSERTRIIRVLSAAKHDEIDQRCSQVAVDEVDGELIAREDAGCLYWIQNVTMSEDDHWMAKGTPHKAHFPKKSYFRHLLGAMMRPIVHPADKCQQLYIPKSRQMLTSYSVCALIAWMCQWNPGIFWVIQTAKEDKALELIRYTRILYDNQPDWMKERHPMASDNKLERVWANGSRVLGVPKGEDQIRVHHPHGYFADEAAFLPEFAECVGAVQPVARQIIAVSTGNPSPFADACDMEGVDNFKTPHRGVQTWTNSTGIRILRLHYSADPDKTSAWAAKAKEEMVNPADYEQEYEINFAAKLGSLIYQFHPEATLEKSFPIPEHWTRYWAIDPHPRVPHALLWVAIDKWGDGWVYRELWPSRICGQAGRIPEDDNQFRIKQYIEVIQWLESKDNPENAHLTKPERIYRQIIDYAARGFKGTTDDEDQRNFQERYEQAARDAGYFLSFEDAIKHDESASIEMVNEWLKPKDVEQSDGTFKPKSKLHIFQDRCPELIWELRNNRYPTLSPLLAERQDPSPKPVQMRKHVSDCLKYICRAKPEYIPFTKPVSTWKRISPGINF